MSPGPDRADYGRAPLPRQLGKELRVLGQDASVHPGIGDDQEKSIGRIVAPLQGEATVQRLGIADSHLDLHRRAKPTSFYDCIPCPQFQPARARRKRHLSAIPEWMAEILDESSDAAELGCIPQWLATGIEPDNEIQSKHRSDLRDLHDRRGPPLCCFDAAERRARQMRSFCYLSLAQPRGQALPLELIGNRLDEPLAVS